MESVALLVVLLLLIVWAAYHAYRRGQADAGLLRGQALPRGQALSRGPAPGVREHYGPPPGAVRALSHYELGDRGWPSYPWEYNANTASAISGLIERSA